MNSIQTNLDGRHLRIGIVQSRFNEPIVVKMNQACVDALLAHGVKAANITHITVHAGGAGVHLVHPLWVAWKNDVPFTDNADNCDSEFDIVGSSPRAESNDD